MSWLFVIKLGLLVCLWALFFSPSHRVTVDSGVTAEHFGVADSGTGNPMEPAGVATSAQTEKARD
jgi:hypothetical protein